MYSRRIQDDINRLVVPGKPRVALNTPTPNAGLPATTGTGQQTAVTSAASIGAGVRMEYLTLWSTLLVTEYGAFEVPPSWPTSGTYGAMGEPVGALPAGVTYSGGVLTLDNSINYYLQRRAHVSIFIEDGSLKEDWFLVPLAYPYIGGVMQGASLLSATSWTPVMAYNTYAPTNTSLAARIAQYNSAGIFSG